MRAWIVAALLLLLSGCECFPGAGVSGSKTVTFGADFCRKTEIHRIEFRSSDNEVLWRLDAEPPIVVEGVEGQYGIAPSGFRQTFPRGGAPEPLVAARGSLTVYANDCILTTPFCRGSEGYVYDLDSSSWSKDYRKP